MHTIHLHSSQFIVGPFRKVALCGRYVTLSAHINCFNGEKLTKDFTVDVIPVELCGSCVERHPLALLAVTELE